MTRSQALLSSNLSFTIMLIFLVNSPFFKQDIKLPKTILVCLFTVAFGQPEVNLQFRPSCCSAASPLPQLAVSCCSEVIIVVGAAVNHLLTVSPVITLQQFSYHLSLEVLISQQSSYSCSSKNGGPCIKTFLNTELKLSLHSFQAKMHKLCHC